MWCISKLCTPNIYNGPVQTLNQKPSDINFKQMFFSIKLDAVVKCLNKEFKSLKIKIALTDIKDQIRQIEAKDRIRQLEAEDRRKSDDSEKKPSEPADKKRRRPLRSQT